MRHSENFLNNSQPSVRYYLEVLCGDNKPTKEDTLKAEKEILMREVDRLQVEATRFKKSSAKYRVWLGWILIKARRYQNTLHALTGENERTLNGNIKRK